MNKLTLSDLKTTYYKIVDNQIEIPDKKYYDYEEAFKMAIMSNGRVIKVTKRYVETMEFEKIS